jgi:dimethylargininase
MERFVPFTKAIVRPPAPNFAEGLTTVSLGAPEYELALAQYERYCAALEGIGLTLIRLPADPTHPDSTFVEDTAVLTARAAILCRPGAPSRQGEVASIRDVLAGHYKELHAIEAPGTVDGGDVCEAGENFVFIGISARTNEEGARQLAEILARAGISSAFVDIREVPGILHLKSGVAYIGDEWLVIIDALAAHPAFQAYNQVRITTGEEYAANCIHVNDHILVAAGYPELQGTLQGLGRRVIPLEMSELRKMDGGLSCLSLRF